jgi:tripartite-type tricarboxylate transporter receptor subunit TctC
MMLATPTLLAPHLYKKTGYDVLKDFAPIATVYDLPIVMVVNPAMLPDVKDVTQLIAKAKAQPGQLNYTSSGTGSFGHLTTEMLKGLGGFDMMHVPYKGGVPAMTDVLGGQVPVMYADMVVALPHIQAGKLRAIAVGSPKRVPFTPDVKTVAEQGFPGFDAVSWGGLLAPAGTPKEIVARISDEVKAILDEKDVQEKLMKAGTFAAYQTPAQSAARIRNDYERWGKVIREKGITAD